MQKCNPIASSKFLIISFGSFRRLVSFIRADLIPLIMFIWKKWRIKWDIRIKKTLRYSTAIIDKLKYELVWWRKKKIYFKYLEFEFASSFTK